MRYSFQEQLMTAYKQYLIVKDIRILTGCSSKLATDYHNLIIRTLGESYIYPIPAQAVIDILGIDMKRLEKAAFLENKLNKKDV